MQLLPTAVPTTHMKVIHQPCKCTLTSATFCLCSELKAIYLQSKGQLYCECFGEGGTTATKQICKQAVVDSPTPWGDKGAAHLHCPPQAKQVRQEVSATNENHHAL